MDKGVCHFVNSEIQTWPPSTIKVTYYLDNIRRCMLEYVTLLAPLKRSYGNKAKWYSERIVSEAKQESLLLYTDNVKITPVDYYKFIL